MGITWLAEIVSHAIDVFYGRVKFRYIISVFKIINALQGVILFVVIVFDTATITLIKQKLFGIQPPSRNSHSRVSAARPSRTSMTSVATASLRKISRLVPDKMRKKSSPQPPTTSDGNEERVELKESSPSPTPIEIEA